MTTRVLRRAAVGSLVAAALLAGCGGKSTPKAAPTTLATLPATTTTKVPRPTTTAPVSQYIVAKHDTMRRIAAKFGVTVDAIMAVNPKIKDPNKIQIGQRIVIPPRPPVATTVKPPAPATTAKKKP